jgi:hypothetical protein
MERGKIIPKRIKPMLARDNPFASEVFKQKDYILQEKLKKNSSSHVLHNIPDMKHSATVFLRTPPPLH